MMRPLNVVEWLEPLALHEDFAREALEIVEQADLIDGYYAICSDLASAAGKEFPENEHWRALEHLRDKKELLDELGDTLEKAGFAGDIDDALQAALDELEELRTENEALKAPDPLEYDL